MMTKKVFFTLSTIVLLFVIGHIFTIGYGFGYDAISRTDKAVEQAKQSGYQPSHLAVIYERRVEQRNDFLHLEVDTTYRAIGRHAFQYKMICDREITLRAYDGAYIDCSDMAASCFVFADNNRKWQLAGEQKQIIDQKCKSATTSIDGEEYKAYYTLALPHCAVEAQPSQLYEGLILEAYDADGSYSLKAIHIAQHLG
ncbi:MAG: hypothetical protein IJN45_09335 [Alistipes sp.]|nr:hypothetical protein [Alistipes sp.]